MANPPTMVQLAGDFAAAIAQRRVETDALEAAWTEQYAIYSNPISSPAAKGAAEAICRAIARHVTVV